MVFSVCLVFYTVSPLNFESTESGYCLRAGLWKRGACVVHGINRSGKMLMRFIPFTLLFFLISCYLTVNKEGVFPVLTPGPVSEQTLGIYGINEHSFRAPMVGRRTCCKHCCRLPAHLGLHHLAKMGPAREQCGSSVHSKRGR